MKIPRTFREFLIQVTNVDAIALVDAKTGQEISYLELYKKSCNIAYRLDITVGDRVILYELPQLEWVICFFAIQLRGGIVVPIDERVSTLFVEKVIKSVEPVLVISNNNSLFESLHKINYQDLCNLPVIQETIADTDFDNPCQIIFTSGTWSDPKGVVLSQRNMLSNVEQILSVYPDKKSSVVLGILPLSHAYQQTLGLFTPLALGSKIVFLKISNSVELLEVISKYQVSVIPLVPRVLELLYSSITRKIQNKTVRNLFVSLVLKSRFLPRLVRRKIFFFIHNQLGHTLTTFVSGGSSLDIKTDNFFQGLGYKVMVGYGLSECSPIVSAHFGQSRVKGEVGKPLSGVDIEFKPDGEICVSGENVFLGYWPNYSKVSSLSTGDIGEKKSNGSLILRGRNKNLIIFDSGEKCFCEDMESIVCELDDVDVSCVVEKNRNDSVVAECLVGTKNVSSLSEEKVLKHFKARLPMGISVSRCVVVGIEDFPVTHTLKPNRTEVSRLLN